MAHTSCFFAGLPGGQVFGVEPLETTAALSKKCGNAFAEGRAGSVPGISNVFPNGFNKGPYIPIAFTGFWGPPGLWSSALLVR